MSCWRVLPQSSRVRVRVGGLTEASWMLIVGILQAEQTKAQLKIVRQELKKLGALCGARPVPSFHTVLLPFRSDPLRIEATGKREQGYGQGCH